jgi:tetratricopeptide (TPR) repeat protein
VAVSLALAGLTLVAFLPACGNGFVEYDDQLYVTENPHVRAGLTGEDVTWALTATHAGNWHPLTWWSLQLDAQLYGADPAGFHLTNVLLHAATAVLLFWVLRLMTGALWPSAATAAVFAVHPLRVESVAWAAERKDVLGALFWMLTLLAYVWYARRPGPGRYLAVAAAFALGLAAKPMLVTLPCVLLLLDYWPLGRLRRDTVRRLVLEKLPLLALAAAACAATLAAQRVTVQTLDQLPLDVRLGNALISYARYLGLFLCPVGLAAFYPHPRLGLLTPQALAAGALLVGITALAVWQSRRRPYLLVGWLWYLGTLVPVIGLVQVGGQGLADRYTYIPLVGVTVALVWGLAELADRSPRWRTALRVAGGAAVALLIVITWRQVDHWRDTVSLWRHALAVTSDNYEVHRNLAVVLDRQGKADEALHHYRHSLAAHPDKRVAHNDLGAFWMRRGGYGEAAAHFRASLEIDPGHPMTHNNLGSLLLTQSKPGEAEPHLRAAARAMPDFAAAHFNLALACAALGRADEAEEHFADGRRLEPDNADAHHWFGNALRIHGEPDRAVRYLEAARDLRPDDPEVHHDLGLAHQARRTLPEAVESYRQAVRLDPASGKYHRSLAHACREAGDAEHAAAHYREATRLDPDWPARLDDQAWRLTTHPDPGRRDGPLAVRLAEQVCQATGYERPQFLDTLAAAYAETGRFDEAVELARKARDLAAAARQTALADEVRDRLRLYESRQPFRDKADETPPRR